MNAQIYCFSRTRSGATWIIKSRSAILRAIMGAKRFRLHFHYPFTDKLHLCNLFNSASKHSININYCCVSYMKICITLWYVIVEWSKDTTKPVNGRSCKLFHSSWEVTRVATVNCRSQSKLWGRVWMMLWASQLGTLYGQHVMLASSIMPLLFRASGKAGIVMVL